MRLNYCFCCQCLLLVLWLYPLKSVNIKALFYVVMGYAHIAAHLHSVLLKYIASTVISLQVQAQFALSTVSVFQLNV